MPMNCPNCGAPMTLIPGHAYYTCAYCTTFVFPAQNEEHVRVLAEPVGMACPLCKHELVAGSVAGTRVGYCAHCRGSLANRESFAGVVRVLRSRAQTPAGWARPRGPRPTQRATRSPPTL